MPTGVYKRTKEFGERMRKTALNKGYGKWMKGKKLSEETRKKISIANKGRVSPMKGMTSPKKGKSYLNHSDNNHGGWKGNMVGYGALHSWIRRKMGKANKCSNNSSRFATRYHWANISGEYKRDLEDWRELCPKCNRLENHDAKRIFISKIKYLSIRRGGEDLRH